MIEGQRHAELTQTNGGVGYCVWGVVALIVGLFAFGIFMGLLTVQLGDKGIAHGATTFGKVVKVAESWNLDPGDVRRCVSVSMRT